MEAGRRSERECNIKEFTQIRRVEFVDDLEGQQKGSVPNLYQEPVEVIWWV